MNFKRKALLILSLLVFGVIFNACGAKKSSNENINLNAMTLSEIEEKAKSEKEINSVGMPDTWANWEETWDDITAKYGVKHSDTDLSSAEELALFEAEKNKPTKDIGDVGQSFGPIAVEKDLVLAYKTSYWDEIPDWAKDKEGKWVIAYSGTMSFIINKNKVTDIPKSFKDLLNGNYKVTIGDVNKSNQAQNVVLSAAYAFGGDENNLEPALEFFAKLAAKNRLDLGANTLARVENGEIEVAVLWDFNSLNMRDSIMSNNPNMNLEVLIPSDAAVQSGYSTIINKYAPHPYLAALTREFILSDKGQINLAKGYARPIRKNVKLPKDVEDKLLPIGQYKNARPIKDLKAWDINSKKIGQTWQEKVLSNIK